MSLNLDYYKVKQNDLGAVLAVPMTDLFINKAKKASGSKKREIKLIIVDDDQEDILHFSELLIEVFGEKIDFQIETSASFLDAKTKLESTDYDLAIFDFRLGYQDGLELYEKVKKSKPKLPVVFVTGQGNECIAVAAIKQGAADYLVKDYLDAKLVEEVFRPYFKLNEQSLSQSMRAVINKSQERDETKLFDGLNQLAKYQPKQLFLKSQAFKHQGGDHSLFQHFDKLMGGLNYGNSIND